MRRLLIPVFLLLAFCAQAQSLLLNGDMEEENICTEYKQNCAPEVWLTTAPDYPYFFNDPEMAYSGERYIAVAAGNARMLQRRSYVRARLLCAMRPGASYRLQFYVRTEYPGLVDSLGVLFSPFDFLCNKTEYRDISASLYFAEAIKAPAKKGWTRVVFDFTAKGNEAYMVLGNFKRVDYSSGTASRSERFMVFIDSVSLTPKDPYERYCRDWEAQKESIYSQNDRHQYQIRHMYACSRRPQDPTVLPPTVVVKVDTIVVPDVLFNTASYELSGKAVALLDSVIRKVGPGGLDSLLVVGHTDSQGDTAYNQELSENRARAVGHYFEYSMKIPVTTIGYGPLRPVADNNTRDGRRRNRRVELYLYLRN